MLNLPHEKGRPEANPERPGEAQQATKHHCPITLRLAPLSSKSILLPAPHRPDRRLEIMGPARPGDRRTLDERWTDFNAWFEGWGPES
jgi:hypothetical protein